MAFCQNCGKELNEGAKFCDGCGSKLGEITPSNSQDDSEEKIIMKGLCSHMKSALNSENGKAMLTNKRFVFFKHSFAEKMLAGVFTDLTAGKIDFEIPISNIESMEDGRMGIYTNTVITTKSGEKFSFKFTKAEEWKIAIQNAINKSKRGQ